MKEVKKRFWNIMSELDGNPGRLLTCKASPRALWPRAQ